MSRAPSIRTGLTAEEIKQDMLRIHAPLGGTRTGKFSSDRSIRDYCGRVWNIKPGH